MVKVILIIPAFNEEKTIVPVINEAKRYVNEIIVVDDGSKDNTIKVAKQAGAKVVLNIINRGLGVTIRKGYIAALKSGADIVVQTDADGQYTLSDIPKMIKLIKENQADVVLTSRFRGGIENMPFGKKIGNRIGTIVTRIVSGYPTTDAQSGYRAYRKEVLQEILPTNKMTYVQEMIIRPAKEGWRIKEIPSFFKKRGGDGKSRLIGSLFGYAKKAIMIITRSILDYNPLGFFGIPGTLIFLIGLVFGIRLVRFYIGGMAISSMVGTVILSSFLMICGVLLFAIGLLADMIRSKTNLIRKEMRE